MGCAMQVRAKCVGGLNDGSRIPTGRQTGAALANSFFTLQTAECSAARFLLATALVFNGACTRFGNLQLVAWRFNLKFTGLTQNLGQL